LFLQAMLLLSFCFSHICRFIEPLQENKQVKLHYHGNIRQTNAGMQRRDGREREPEPSLWAELTGSSGDSDKCSHHSSSPLPCPKPLRQTCHQSARFFSLSFSFFSLFDGRPVKLAANKFVFHF